MSQPSSLVRRALLLLVGGLAALLWNATPAAATGDENVHPVGTAPYLGSSGATVLDRAITGMAATPSGDGYWLIAGDGRLFGFGDALALGAPSGQDIVDMAPTPSGQGYWRLSANGQVSAFGDAVDHGSMSTSNAVAIRPTADGGGYWIATADGAVHTLGNAPFFGSMAGVPLHRPMVDFVARPAGDGYWLLAEDGGIFAFGGAPFFGSTGGTGATAAAMESTPSGSGYWIAGADGAIDAFGDAVFFADVATPRPVVAMASTPAGDGLWLASEGNGPSTFGTIEGLVRNDTGAPAPGVCVSASNGPPSYQWIPATSGDDGRYRMSNVPAGDYSMSASHCGDQAYLSTSVQGSVTVVAGQATVVDIDIRRAARVSGMVTDANGAPAQGVCVNVMTLDRLNGSGGSTATDGTYNVGGLVPGEYRVEFRNCWTTVENFAPEWWNDKPDEASADPLALSEGDHVTNIDAAMAPGAAILGTVTTPTTNQVCVQAYTTSGVQAAQEFSNPDGTYRLAGLAAGDYHVRFSQCEMEPQYAPEWWDDQAGRTTANVITLAPGATVEQVDAELAAGGRITGTVRDDLGNGAGGVCLEARDVDGTYSSWGFTNGDGTYAIPGLATSSYKVRAYDCGHGIYTEEWYDGKASFAEADAVATVQGATVSGIDFALVGSAGAISGTITDSAGGPLSDVCVNVLDSTGWWQSSAESGPDGRYRVSPVVAGEYRVQLNDCGGYGYATEYYDDQPTLSTATPVLVVVGTDTTVDEDFGVLSAPARPFDVSARAGSGSAFVSWQQGGNGGRPVTSYTVTLVQTGEARTTSTESITFDGLVNGETYSFNVTATNEIGTSEAASSNSVTPGDVSGAPTDVVATPGDGYATVSWTAPADDGGTPISHYLVRYSDGNEAVAFSTSIDLGLVNGQTYTFTVKAHNQFGYGPESAPSNPVTPATIPGPAGDVVATPGDGSATITWSPPVDDGGSPVLGYYVHVNETGDMFTTSETSYTVTGLTNGSPYSFVVQPYNAVGPGMGTSAEQVVPAGVPLAPHGVTAVAGDGTATVNWNAPDGNGSPITGYTVTASNGTTVAGTATTATFTGLANGTAYTFTVRAANGVGEGPESAPSNEVVPAGLPGMPTDVVAVRGDGSATVSWTAPDANGSAVTGYTVAASRGGVVVTTSATSVVVEGLANGLDYTFTVRATNGVGDGGVSAPSNSVVPAGLPGTSPSVTAVAGDGYADLSWTVPDSNGAAITAYTITASDGATMTTDQITARFVGLANGATYTFTVQATNEVGDGGVSPASNPVTPAGPPSAPTGVTATAGNGSATVSWTASSGNGSVVTGYTVTASNGASVTTTGTSTVVGGLANGTSYTFTVRATNGIGDSAESAPSNAVVPAAPPGAPTNVRATAGNGSATVSWTAPASDGGSPVTLYTVTSSGGTTATTTGTSVTVTGLSNLTAYTFTVRAANAIGGGPESAPSNLVVPLPLPGSLP